MRAGKKKKKRQQGTRRAACSPGRTHDESGSCMTGSEVEELRLAWNKAHPGKSIAEGSKSSVIRRLRALTRGSCKDDACWSTRRFARSSPGATAALAGAHRPMAPRAWAGNPREWLTSDDIDAVMHQYEKEYSHFAYLGASPIDFDAKPRDSGDKCVWVKLCDLSIANELAKGKTQMAVILNADPHYEDGSHWMTLFINLNERYILYFDSTGDPPPREVRRLVSRLREEARRLGLHLRLIINKTAHQKQNTECGVYGLYVVSQLLEGRQPVQALVSKRVPDDAMFAFRRKFFNHMG